MCVPEEEKPFEAQLKILLNMNLQSSVSAKRWSK